MKKSDIDKINNDMELQTRISNLLLNSDYKPVKLGSYDGKPVDAICIPLDHDIKIEVDKENLVHRIHTAILSVYLVPNIGKVSKNTWYVATDISPYYCGIQKNFSYYFHEYPSSPLNFPVLNDVKMTLMNANYWTNDKMESEFGKSLDKLDYNVFVPESNQVFILYADNISTPENVKKG